MKSFKFSFFFYALFLLSACQTTAPALKKNTPTRLTIGNKIIDLETLLTLLPEKDLAYQDPFEGSTQIARGVPLHLVLDSYMGSSWKNLDGILFRTQDGSKRNVAVEKILRYRPLLAYRYVDKLRRFQVAVSPDHNLMLGPFYLVWDNFQYPELKADPSPHKTWPYQIVRIEAIRYSSEYAKRFRK